MKKHNFKAIYFNMYFEVSVYDSTLMKVSDGVDDGTDDFSGLFFCVDYFLSDLVIELSSW